MDEFSSGAEGGVLLKAAFVFEIRCHFMQSCLLEVTEQAAAWLVP